MGDWRGNRVEQLVVSLDDDESQVNGLLGQSAGSILEHGDEMRRDVVGVENGRAGLEGGGDAVLERRHGLDLIEGSHKRSLCKRRVRIREREKVVAPEMPLPGFFDVWSCPSSRVKMFWFDATAAAAAVRDPTSWRAEESGAGDGRPALKIYQSFWGGTSKSQNKSTNPIEQRITQHRQGPQCHLKKSPRSQISGASPCVELFLTSRCLFALFEEWKYHNARPAHAASPAPNGNRGGEDTHQDALLLNFVWSRGGKRCIFTHVVAGHGDVRHGIGTCGRPWIEREFPLTWTPCREKMDVKLAPSAAPLRESKLGTIRKACPAVDEGGKKTCVACVVSVTSR